MRSSTYDAHETARMEALHGCELAPFRTRALALAVDFAIETIVAVDRSSNGKSKYESRSRIGFRRVDHPC